MQIAQVLAGYTLGGADLLRRAMGKKIKAEMDAQRTAVRRRRGRRAASSARTAEHDLRSDGEIRRLRLQQIARRRLCAGRLSDRLSEGELPGRVPRRVDDARPRQHRQAQRLPPGTATGSASRCCRPTSTARRSTSRSRPTPRAASRRSAMRWPRSRASARRRCASSSPSATRNGPFKDLFDFARRLDAKSFNRRQFESLVKAGAFDCLNPNRAQSLRRRRAAAAPGQPSPPRSARASRTACSAAIDPGFAPRPSLPLVAGLAAGRAAAARIRGDRLLPVEPPARSLRQEPRARRHHALRRSAGGARRQRLDAASARRHRRSARKERTSARGNRFAFVQMSDTERHVRGDAVLGDAGAGARPARWRPAAGRHGRCAQRGGQPAADGAEDRAARQRSSPKPRPGCASSSAEAEALPRLKSLITREAGGRGRVTVVLDLPSREVEIALPGGFRVDPRIRAAVKSLPGIIDVHDI